MIGDAGRERSRHSECRLDLITRQRGHPGDCLLALAGGLPDLGRGMPHVVGVEETSTIGCPRVQQIGSRCGDGVDVPCTPVVPDQVDGRLESFDLVDQPVAVVLPGRSETLRDGGTESGWRQQHDVADSALIELADQS